MWFPQGSLTCHIAIRHACLQAKYVLNASLQHSLSSRRLVRYFENQLSSIVKQN